MLEIFSPSRFICIHRLLLSYHLPGKSLASTENKNQSTKMQNSNVTISKHKKLHTNFVHASQLYFLVLYFNCFSQEISVLKAHICLKVSNYCMIQKCFSRMLKISSITKEQIENGILLNKIKSKLNLNLFVPNLVLSETC